MKNKRVIFLNSTKPDQCIHKILYMKMLWRLEVIFQKQENTFFRKWLHLKKITMVKNK